jgi:hypothetical protein
MTKVLINKILEVIAIITRKYSFQRGNRIEMKGLNKG